MRLRPRLEKAVRHFWAARITQSTKKPKGRSVKANNKSNRDAVTGGKYLDGFRELVADLLSESGIKHATIYWRKKTELPGWYRAEKNWDLLVVVDRKPNRELVAVIEFKSLVGSVSNNANNRFEESIGSATDFWTAYAEGAFGPSQRPWLGFFFLLEDAPKSRRPVRVKEPHFKVFAEFRVISYIERFGLLLTRLLRSKMYDATCLILSPSTGAETGEYIEPIGELSFRTFAASLVGRAMAVALLQPDGPPDPPTVEVGPDTESPDE